MKKKTLVVLAAGMGSRFGGMKQIEPVGPNGEFIIDYSIYSAIKYGFNKIVFVIKKVMTFLKKLLVLDLKIMLRFVMHFKNLMIYLLVLKCR